MTEHKLSPAQAAVILILHEFLDGRELILLVGMLIFVAVNLCYRLAAFHDALRLLLRDDPLNDS